MLTAEVTMNEEGKQVLLVTDTDTNASWEEPITDWELLLDLSMGTRYFRNTRTNKSILDTTGN